MDMHHATDKPDWTATPRNKRNVWQRVAARTNGVGTPGNVLSLIGFFLVLIGLWLVMSQRLWEGTLFVSIGRSADILDGIIAHRTGTKSPLGRVIDASLDKIGALVALVVFAADGELPLWITGAILLQNVANIIISIYAPWRKLVLNPSRAGKVAAAGFWITIIAFVAAHLLMNDHLPAAHRVVLDISYVIAIGSLSLGFYATVDYMITVLHMPRRNP